MMPKPSLFAEEERGNRRAKIGGPLIGLSEHVDFIALAAGIDTALPRPSRAKGGRPPYSTVLMIKILVLQQFYNLADDALEYQLLDRRSFLQFLGLTDSSTIPDAKTIWLFRDRLAQAGLGTQLFDEVQQQLLAQGYQARCGQIIDASLVQAPVQRKADLKQAGWRAHIQRKGTARKAISATQKQRNRRIATPRARVEHVFGALAQMGGKLVRCTGIVRTTFALNLKAASYTIT